MPETRVRVVGSGFTTFNYRGKPIAFLDSVTDSGQRVFGTGVEAIIPLDAKHPVEIATGRVVDVGTLVLSIRELWNLQVWNQLAGLEDVGSTITDVYQALADDPNSVTCQKIIRPPGSSVWRGTTYHGCVVTAIQDQETISVGALSIAKGITVAYTHKTSFTTPANGTV